MARFLFSYKDTCSVMAADADLFSPLPVFSIHIDLQDVFHWQTVLEPCFNEG